MKINILIDNAHDGLHNVATKTATKDLWAVEEFVPTSKG